MNDGEQKASDEVFFTVFQIYNEHVYDLLQDPEMDTKLKVRENRQQGIFVEGITEYLVIERLGETLFELPECISCLVSDRIV